MSEPVIDKPEDSLSKVEAIKKSSDHLRGTLAEELKNDSDRFNEDSTQLLKFHGLYQQKDREKKGEVEPPYSLMLRGRVPGGRLTAQQFAVWDDLSHKYGDRTFRLTTRQSIQLHGILKRNVKSTIQEIHEMLLTSIGACGDVVRNVTQAVNPWGSKELSQLDAIATQLSDHYKYSSRAYGEIWLDDQLQNPEPEIEKIYGDTYLPRKFKIAVTLAGNNSVDIYTNDMGFAATIDSYGVINGYFVFAGGGMGMTHNKPDTFPRKADLLGWINAGNLMPVADAIVLTQRDNGDRTNRKHARLKYLIHNKGIGWFTKEVEARSNVKFIQKPLPEWKTPSYLGWHKRTDGTNALGFHVLSGRVKDSADYPLKSALREIITDYNLDVQITADQDLVLLGIRNDDKAKIIARLAELKVNPDSPKPLYDRALACPALPTCGLAITESERFLPNLLGEIQKLIDKYDLNDRAPVLRMTGCPNGCARPYSAELGLVGQQTGGRYAIFVGGDHEGTRIGKTLAEKVKIPDFLNMLDKLFDFWKQASGSKETFGDFTHRIPMERLRERVLQESESKS